jgi:hypothetical protein
VRKFLIGGPIGAAVLATAAVAVASPQFQQTATVKLTTKKPHANSGLVISLNAQDPGAPGGKPSPATSVKVTLPKGTVVNTAAAKVCTASDQTFADKGAKACPAGSRLGTGSAEAITGLGAGIDPVGENIVAFAGKNQIIFFLTPKGTIGQTAVIRGKIRKNVVNTPVPAFPLPGGGGNAALTVFKINLKAYAKGSGAKQKRVLTTPSKCPKGHNWVTNVKFKYEDGTSASINSRSTCK